MSDCHIRRVRSHAPLTYIPIINIVFINGWKVRNIAPYAMLLTFFQITTAHEGCVATHLTTHKLLYVC